MQGVSAESLQVYQSASTRYELIQSSDLPIY